MQIIHFKKFSVPVSTGTSKGDKLLKMALDSISDSLSFQNLLGTCPQTPLVLVCFTCLCTLHTMRVHIPASSTLTMMTDMTVLSFSKSRFAPDLSVSSMNLYHCTSIYVSCVTIQYTSEYSHCSSFTCSGIVWFTDN